jgi:hypothetical protein
MLSRLKELGPCILPGGKGSPQVIISSKYTKLKTIKGDWPIMRTGQLSDYTLWAEQLVNKYPEKFLKNIVVYQRTVPEYGMHSRYKTIGSNVVYFIGSDEMNYVKIGTTNDIDKRLSGIQTSVPFDLKVILVIDGGPKEEKKAHTAFEQQRKRGEWFVLDGKLKAYLEYMHDKENPHKEPWEFVL